MMRRYLNQTFAFFASYGLSIVLLFLLLVLVFLGTIEQVNQGLYEVQKRYFESFFVVHYLGPLPIPLPGAYLLLGLLLINLICGAIVRPAMTTQRIGLLIGHFGIIFMILAGFVTYHYSTSGHMTLYEGESSNEFQSYYDWEVIVRALSPPGHEWVIPQEDFKRLDANERRVFYAEDLPFELELRGFMKNAHPRPIAPGIEQGVDGYLLQERPPETQAEANIAGLYAAVIEAPSGVRHEGILWGMSRGPWMINSQGVDYAIDLRHRRWQVPFTIHLEKFTRELHPRTGIPSNFMSDVVKIENGTPQHIEIKMNEPLRQHGYTFFQSSWGPQNARGNERLFSVFAVVRNPADQWPLYATVIVSLGLVIHFLQKLFRYLRAQNRRTE